MSFQIKTIQDLERLYYSDEGARWIAKIDAPVISTTTGVYNAIYGAQVWNQLNQEANIFGALPKEVWGISGWRVISADSGTLGDGGVAENGAIPDTAKPTFVEISTKPKTVAHAFNNSEVQEFLAALSGDDAIGEMEFLRAYFAGRHKRSMNVMLTADNDTVAGNNLESLDRVCADNAEVALVDANDLDIYGLDRDAGASHADAYVDDNSGTDRSLTDTLVTTLIQNIGTNGGNTTFFYTGHDSVRVLLGQYQTQVRYQVVGEVMAQFSVNGIDTEKGVQFGVRLPSLYGTPLLKSKDTNSDTISRFYALDTSDPEGFGRGRLALSIAKPTRYFETGINQGNPFALGTFSNEGLYSTMGELICRFFAAQGKIRDLKA